MKNKKNAPAKKWGDVTGSVLYRAFRLFFLVGTSFLTLYPILSMVLSSLASPNDLLNENFVWIPDNPTLTNFTGLFSYFDYWSHAKITISIVLICTVLQLVVCSLTGYALARYKFKGNAFWFMCVVLTIIVPIQTVQLPMYASYRNFDFFGIGTVIGWFTGTKLTVNLLNSLWVYIVPALFGVGLSSGLYIFLFRQFFKGLPRDLEEAARVDGCNAFQIFVKIMIPNTVPVFVTVAMLSSIFYWNDTVISKLFYNRPEMQPLMLYVEQMGDPAYMQYKNLSYMEFTSQMYVLILTVVAPLVLIYIAGQNFFTECMDRSGIKG